MVGTITALPRNIHQQPSDNMTTSNGGFIHVPAPGANSKEAVPEGAWPAADKCSREDDTFEEGRCSLREQRGQIGHSRLTVRQNHDDSQDPDVFPGPDVLSGIGHPSDGLVLVTQAGETDRELRGHPRIAREDRHHARHQLQLPHRP